MCSHWPALRNNKNKNMCMDYGLVKQDLFLPTMMLNIGIHVNEDSLSLRQFLMSLSTFYKA